MTSQFERRVGPRLSTLHHSTSGAEFPAVRKPKQNFKALSRQVDELVRSGDVKGCEMVLTKLVVAAREPVQLSQTLQKLAGMRSENNSKMVDDLVVEILERLGRVSLCHIPARTACTILRSVERLPNISSAHIVDSIDSDLAMKKGSILLSSATGLDAVMLLHYFAARTGTTGENVIYNLIDFVKSRASELDNVSYPIAAASLGKLSFCDEEARQVVKEQLCRIVPTMTAGQLAQTYEGLQGMKLIDDENSEMILSSFLALSSGVKARDWTRLMVSVARVSGSRELPRLLECVQLLVVDENWGSAGELVEILHSMALASCKDPVVLSALAKRLRPSILAERSSIKQLQLVTCAISYMSAIRTMVTTMEELLEDVEKLLLTQSATTIQIHQILAALVRQEERLARNGHRQLIHLCEEQWCSCHCNTSKEMTSREFLSTMVLFAEINKGVVSERLARLILRWWSSEESDRVNVLDAIQLASLLSKICKASDFYSTEVVGEAADMIDAVYDYACHRLCLREWKASEFAVFVSQLAAAGDAGLYDAEGLSRTISLHVQRHGHAYDCRHITLVTEALSRLAGRVQDGDALGPLWHEISSRLAVFQGKQLLTIGVAMSKFTADSVTAIQYRNFPLLSGAFPKEGALLASLDTCSRVELISAWARVGALSGALLEAVASSLITESQSLKNPVRDAGRILLALYCVNLHSLRRNSGPNSQALVRHCRETLEAAAPFAPSIAPEDLVRVLISVSASSVLSPPTVSRTDIVARSALECLAKFHYKWLITFLSEGGPSRSMFTMATAWLSESGVFGDDEGLIDEGTKARLVDLLAGLNVPEKATPLVLPLHSQFGKEALTVEEQSILRRLGTNAVSLASTTPPFTVRLATKQGVAIEILGEREVLGQREDLVAWTKIRLTLLANRGWKIALLRPSERIGLKNADSLYELALSKIEEIL